MIKIEQDGFYLNAMGEIIHIKTRGDGYFLDENGNKYSINGVFGGGNNSDYDLIAYIPKELHYRLLESINGYHTCKPVKTFINKLYKELNEMQNL